MKKWLYLSLGLAAVGILSRLPHPAQDISALDPVRTVYLYMEDGMLHMQTDTGDHGSGADLTEALADMKANADSVIYLETAEYLILHPQVPLTDAIYTLLRPACRVVFAAERPDMSAVSQYLAAHEPELTLARLRAAYHETGRSHTP